MQKPQKPTVWILDDQWNSALEKIAFFFSFTDAAIEKTNSPEGLKALEASCEAAGWALIPLKPEEIPHTDLKNGIVLVDVNWSEATSSEIGLQGLHPEEKRHYGITLVREIIAQRHSEDNLDIVLFSHTEGDELTASFFEMSRQGVKRLYPVVISQSDSKGRRIRSYGCEARDRITGELLQKLPAQTRSEIASMIQSRLADKHDYVSLKDFTGGIEGVSIGSISLTDLATPYLKSAQAEQTKAKFNGSGECISSDVEHWRSLLLGDHTAFELDDSLRNVPTTLLRALLRYRKIDHFDGFVLLQDIRGSRYVDPVGALQKNLAGDRSKLSHAPLYKGFKHKITVGLGTPIGKIKTSLERNQPIPDLGKSFSPFQKLPEILRDPAILDYSDSDKNDKATAKLHIFDHGNTGLRIEIADDTIWENALIQASNRLTSFLANPEDPTELLKIHEIDSGNSQVCLEIARHGNAILENLPAKDPRWESALTECRAHAQRLKRAEGTLTQYSKKLLAEIDRMPESQQRDFCIDLERSEKRREQWKTERETIETFLNQFELPETRSGNLAQILDRTDTPEGADQLEAFLIPYLPRVRAYARKAIENTLERTGLLSEKNLRQADKAFARIFPASNQEACQQNWLSLALAALGPRIESISTLPNAEFEDMIVPTLAKELLQQVTALEGYDFLEGSVEFPEDGEVEDMEDGVYSIRTQAAPQDSE